MKKIFNLKNFLQEKKKLKKQKKKLIITNGCFDILHPGHIKIFELSKKMGDRLLVLVNSDKSVKMNKGLKRPILKLSERLILLSAIKYIDYIIVFHEKTPEILITKVKPEILTKGSQYKKSKIVGSKFVEENGGEVKVIKMLKNHSTTNIIKKIKNI